MTDQVIRIMLDPGPAEAGARRVKRSLDAVRRGGESAANAVREVADSLLRFKQIAMSVQERQAPATGAFARLRQASLPANFLGSIGQKNLGLNSKKLISGDSAGTIQLQAILGPLGKTIAREIARDIRIVVGRILIEEILEALSEEFKSVLEKEPTLSDVDRARIFRQQLSEKRRQRQFLQNQNPNNDAIQGWDTAIRRLELKLLDIELNLRDSEKALVTQVPQPGDTGAAPEALLQALISLNESLRVLEGAVRDLMSATVALREQREEVAGKAEIADAGLRTSPQSDELPQEPIQPFEQFPARPDILPSQGCPELECAVKAQGDLEAVLQETLRRSRELSDGARRAFQDYADAATNAAAQAETLVTKGFQEMEEALVSFVQTGKVDFKSLVDSMVADLLRLTIRSQILGPLAQAFGSALGSSGPFAGGSGPAPGSFRAAQTEGFAHGGSFIVPGSGGIDSVVPIFRATPGERVTVTPPGRGTGGSVVNVNVINEAGARVDVQERDNGQGGIDIEVLIARAVERDIAGGGRVARAIAQNFGARPAAIGR